MSKPFVIAVAGPGSNSGKTHLVCALIRHILQFQSVGAVKIATSTPDHLCARTNLPCDCLKFDGRMRLLKDPAYINKVGKDTARMNDAGATPVWWLQTTSDVQKESTEFLMQTLDGPPIWVIEGSGPIDANVADLSILVARADGKKPKDSWHRLTPKADILAVSHHREVNPNVFIADIPGLSPRASFVHFSGTSGGLPSAFIEALSPILRDR